MSEVIVFGDSIVYGACDYEKGGWVNRLKLFLNKKDIDVYGLGISGDDSESLLKRFENEVRPRWNNEEGQLIIIFSIGINDSQQIKGQGERTDLKTFEKNLRLLKEGAEKFTKSIVFCGLTGVDESKTTPIPWNQTKSYSIKNVDRYNGAIEKFCKENNIKFIELKSVVDVKDLEDGLHPNSRGHEKIFERVKESLIKNGFIK